MNIDKAFPSKYLSAGDLDGENRTFTIVGIKLEKVGQDGEKKPVIYFEETDKGFALNKTNKELIKQALGSAETDDWRGQRITLYPTEVPFGDKIVEAIRVRARPQKGQAQAATQGTRKPVRQAVVEDEEGDEPPF